MLGTLFLLASIVFGMTLAYAVPAQLRFEERLFLGIPIGLAVGTLLAFFAALAFGFSRLTVGGVSVALVLATDLAFRSCSLRGRIGEAWTDLTARGRTAQFAAFAGVYAAFGFLLTAICWHVLFEEDGRLYAGFVNVWGDWAQHLSYTAAFAYGDNLPPELPLMSGERLTYHFGADFLSALLIKGGYGLVPAMKVPAVLLALSGLGLLMTFARRLVSHRAALLTPLLFLFAGGLGFVNFGADLLATDRSLGDFLSHLPRAYTADSGASADVASPPLSNLWLINPIYGYLVPQRAFLFGLPLVLGVLLLVYLAVRTRSRSTMLLAGIVTALLPTIHAHGLLFLALLTPPLMLITAGRVAGADPRPTRRVLGFWLCFAAPVVALGVPQALWLTGGGERTSHTRLQLGWLAGSDGPIWFWLKNAGLWLPLLVAALVWLRRRDAVHTALLGAVAAVLVVANVVVFGPHDWDNSKLFVYCYAASLPAIAGLLLWLAQRGRAWKGGVVAIVISLTLAGALDVSRTLPGSEYRVEMFDPLDRELASYVRAHSPPNSIFLTGQVPDNPISALAGRTLVLGYPGWVWPLGIGYRPREADVATMYEGGARTEALLARYGVGYVLIGPSERSTQRSLDEQFFSERFRVWHRSGAVIVYKIPTDESGDTAAARHDRRP